MKDDELPFDRSCHVLYSKPCKKEIQAKIALHYPEAELPQTEIRGLQQAILEETDVQVIRTGKSGL